MVRFLFLLCAAFLLDISETKLTKSGVDFMYNGQKVFLVGPNIAWNNYGYDFGNGNYDGTLETFIADISTAGGNSIRIWVHIEGASTPIFDSEGYVTACDNTGDFANDLKQLLDVAQTYEVLIDYVLWNGAVMNSDAPIGLINDDAKLDSYFDNCLKSVVTSLKGHPALGSWETMNEPEGLIKVESSSESCYNTTDLGKVGAGWTGRSVSMERILRFVGRHNEVFKMNDPTTLTTLGSWNQYPQTNAVENSFNFYSDECLNLASGGTNAGIDYSQMHGYAWGTEWSPGAPFTLEASDYGLDKPIVIGEYASICGKGMSLGDLHQYAYDHGYTGGWSWHWVATGECSDSQEVQRVALGQLTGQTANGAVDFPVE